MYLENVYLIKVSQSLGATISLDTISIYSLKIPRLAFFPIKTISFSSLALELVNIIAILRVIFYGTKTNIQNSAKLVFLKI